MEWQWRRGLLALGAMSFWLGVAPSGAKAQLFGRGSAPMPPSGGAALVGAKPTTGPVGQGGGYGNPYTSPLMNPYLNPYLTQVSTTPGNAALYFFAAQQMNGGLGSGRIGGPRAVEGSAKAKSAAREAEATRYLGSNTPGATASRYFSRNAPAGQGTARYYGRQNGHYPNPGR